MSGSSLAEAFDGAVGTSKSLRRRKQPSPVSIRFTDEERVRLSRDAGKLSLSGYIRQKLFGDAVAPRESRYLRKQQRPVIDDETVARWLGMLGQSELATSMIAIAMAAQSGALPVTPELSDKLNAACDDISDMRIPPTGTQGRHPGKARSGLHSMGTTARSGLP